MTRSYLAFLVLLHALVLAGVNGSSNPFSGYEGTYEGGCTQYGYNEGTSYKCSKYPLAVPQTWVITKKHNKYFYQVSLPTTTSVYNGKTYTQDAFASTTSSLSFVKPSYGYNCVKITGPDGSVTLLDSRVTKQGSYHVYEEYGKFVFGKATVECPTAPLSFACSEKGGYFYYKCYGYRK